MVREKEWKFAVARGFEPSYAPECRITEGWLENPPCVEIYRIGADSLERAMCMFDEEPGA